jgi:hypothetical protein
MFQVAKDLLDVQKTQASSSSSRYVFIQWWRLIEAQYTALRSVCVFMKFG